MDLLKQIFPHAFKSKDQNEFVFALIMYAVIAIVGGLVIGLLVQIPIAGIIFGLLGGIVDLYAIIGLVLSILVFLKIVQ